MESASNAYEKVLGTSLHVGWAIEDVLPQGARLDLSRPMLPESPAG